MLYMLTLAQTLCTPIYTEIPSLVPITAFYRGVPKALSTAEKQGRAGGASRRGGLREAPLAHALAAEDEGGGVALLADAQVARRPRLQVARGAAEEAPHQVVEEVPRVQHVDPRVAAAVEAGQEHGDDEGRGCKAERAIRVLWGRESPREGTGAPGHTALLQKHQSNHTGKDEVGYMNSRQRVRV